MRALAGLEEAGGCGSGRVAGRGLWIRSAGHQQGWGREGSRELYETVAKEAGTGKESCHLWRIGEPIAWAGGGGEQAAPYPGEAGQASVVPVLLLTWPWSYFGGGGGRRVPQHSWCPPTWKGPGECHGQALPGASCPDNCLVLPQKRSLSEERSPHRREEAGPPGTLEFPYSLVGTLPGAPTLVCGESVTPSPIQDLGAQFPREDTPIQDRGGQ